uniref:vWA domain-containing protein n=1 Tax=unclassified Rhodococcus (in: high G+C Gram-positive bacteria) TaxID=192944 RepID=UPI00113FEAB2|nr:MULTISPECIES: VWA domain-containing protein [unclassified Rhodococcus (in: high G+C Gram-positive bacteria)]
MYIFLTDDSASITGMAGNDPLARRYDEARRAIEHIGRACDCGEELVSIIHFDFPSKWDVPPQRLHRRGMDRLRSGLRSDGLPGSSDLGPALDKAERLSRQHPEAVTTLVVMTDFFLTDRDPRAVLNQLISFDGHVHAVALGTEPPAVLQQADHVTTSMITTRSDPGATAQAVFDALMTYRKRTTP